jgi:hypothetical protein
MAPKPHSKTVRGTLDNPKTKEAINSSKETPNLGDATSLKPANDDKKLPANDSAPPRGQGNDVDSKPNQGKNVDTNPGAPTPSNPLPKNATSSSSGVKSGKSKL